MDVQLEYGFGTAVFVMDHVAGKVAATDAEREFNEVTKENFWRMWPDIREWGEQLWQVLEDERGDMARPAVDEELDEVGGGGVDVGHDRGNRDSRAKNENKHLLPPASAVG